MDGGSYPLNDPEVPREERLPPSFWSSVDTPNAARINIPSRLSTSTSAVSSSSPSSDGSAISTGSIHETALLCHYRYHTAPWIDIGDPCDSFGIAVLTLAKNHRPLLAAILALAARQRLCLNLTPDPYGRDEALAGRYRVEAEHGLQSVEPRIQRLARGLLMLQEFLGVGPGEWRHVLIRHWGEGNTPPPVETLDDELMAPLFWLYLRMGKLAYRHQIKSEGAETDKHRSRCCSTQLATSSHNLQTVPAFVGRPSKLPRVQGQPRSHPTVNTQPCPFPPRQHPHIRLLTPGSTPGPRARYTQLPLRTSRLPLAIHAVDESLECNTALARQSTR